MPFVMVGTECPIIYETGYHVVGKRVGKQHDLKQCA